MDKSWLPSKKLVLSFGVMAIMLLGVFFVSKIGKNNDNYFENKDLVVSDLLRNKIIEKDTDGDGLMDWEESLWNTDINKTDTDGDGTNDNDEILQKRNPTITGPDDLLAENFTLNNENIIEYLDEENLTETDKLSRDLLVDYLSMKKSGTLNENKSNLVEYLSQGAINSSADMMGKTYTYSDLNIVESNTKNEFDEYKTIFIKTMTFNNNPSQDFTIFKNALQSKDKLKLKELNTIISLYEGMLKNLLKMNVPSDLAQSHLIILNSFDDMIESTKIMSNIFEDPVAGLAGMSARISSEEVFLVGLNKLNDILEK